MKKIIAVILSLVLVLSMTACGAKEAAPAETQAPEAAGAATELRSPSSSSWITPLWTRFGKPSRLS